MRISILLPTRKRATRLKTFIDNVKNTAHNYNDIEIIFFIDEDDTATVDIVKTLSCKYYLNKLDSGIIFSDMWNHLLPLSEGDIFLTAGDDICFKTQNWDLLVLEEFNKSKDKILLVGTDDGIQHGNFAVHPFVHRNWVNTLGYILPPYFKYWYADNWLTDVAKGVGRFKYMPNILIQHVHKLTGNDETYLKNERHISEATQVWHKTANLRNEDIKKLLNFIENFNE